MGTFLDYIKTRRVTNNPRGDFIDDTRSLRNIPASALQSWDAFESFMHTLCRLPGPCDAAIDEGRKLWREFARKRADEFARELDNEFRRIEVEAREFKARALACRRDLDFPCCVRGMAAGGKTRMKCVKARVR